LEQLNIEGKRSGEGFVVHKRILVHALSRALAERVIISDFTIGRKGFLIYLKSLGGSNVVKVVPASTSSASVSQTTEKRLKVICGSNTSYLSDMMWVPDKPPYSTCEVRVSSANTVKPNLGSSELAEAIERVLPFTAEEESRPVLQNILFSVKEGKLSLISADGYRLAIVTLDCDTEEGQVLIHRDNLKGIATALKSAKRVNLSFSKNGDKSKEGLCIDTELIRYMWYSSDGTYPDYSKLIPAQFNASVSLDTSETLKAVSSLKALAEDGSSAIDMLIGNGKVIFSNPDDKGQAEITAETQGEGKVRLDGGYLLEALRACGGMAELKITDAKSPVLFTVDGYSLIVMPMFAGSQTVKEESKESKPATTEDDKEEAVAEAEAIQPKLKRGMVRLRNR